MLQWHGAWWVVDNTCYDYERGASFLKQTLSSPDDVQIHGNIFATRKEISSTPGGSEYLLPPASIRVST